MRLAVQRLLGCAPIDDGPPQIAQGVGEKRPVRIGEIGSDVTARNVLLHSGDAIHEVRRRDFDLPQAGMQVLERPCVSAGGSTRDSTGSK